VNGKRHQRIEPGRRRQRRAPLVQHTQQLSKFPHNGWMAPQLAKARVQVVELSPRPPHPPQQHQHQALLTTVEVLGFGRLGLPEEFAVEADALRIINME
jgi:hypothetical protein